MTAIPSVGPRATSSDNQTSEAVLQHFYVIAAVVILLALLVLRILVLRRRNQGLSAFFRTSGTSQYPYGSYPPSDSNYGSMFHGLQLARPSTAYRREGRIRAADTDAQGRRLDSTGEGCEWKDDLPAYENLGRLPKYSEVGGSHGNPPPAQSAQGERSGMAQPNIIGEVPGDNSDSQPGDTHAVVGVVHGNEAGPSDP